MGGSGPSFLKLLLFRFQNLLCVHVLSVGVACHARLLTLCRSLCRSLCICVTFQRGRVSRFNVGGYDVSTWEGSHGRDSNKRDAQSDHRVLCRPQGLIETSRWWDLTSDARRIVHCFGDPTQARGLSPAEQSGSRATRTGKLGRTFFTLQWLQDPDLRRRSHVGLNKGEQQNALRRAVFFMVSSPLWCNVVKSHTAKKPPDKKNEVATCRFNSSVDKFSARSV